MGYVVVNRRDRCVLIAGGGGYIGSHNAKALARARFYSLVVNDLRAGYRWEVKWGPLIESNLADKQALRGFRDLSNLGGDSLCGKRLRGRVDGGAASVFSEQRRHHTQPHWRENSARSMIPRRT
jgi:hypothetical protein